MSTRRRIEIVVAIVAIIAIIAFVIYVATRDHDATPISRSASDAAIAVLPPPPRLQPPPGAAAFEPASTGSSDSEDAVASTKPAMGDAPPYPPGSQPLTEGTDPSAGVAEDDPVDEGGGGAHIVFGARYDVVHPPDPIIIDAQLVDAHGKRLPIAHGRVYFRGERDTAATATGPSAPLLDDGRQGDRRAGDLAFTATYAPVGAIPPEAFRTFVELAFDAPAPGTGERHYTTWVQYTPKPAAALTKQFTESIVNGSLVVGAGVDISEAGRFKVIASLYGPDHATAICFAQNSIELAPGAQSIPLTFFGKILHDRAIDGPYTLRFMMVFEEFPQRGTYWPGVTVDDAYTTKAYKAAAFSADPYVPPPHTDPEVTAKSPSQATTPPPMFTR